MATKKKTMKTTPAKPSKRKPAKTGSPNLKKKEEKAKKKIKSEKTAKTSTRKKVVKSPKKQKKEIRQKPGQAAKKPRKKPQPKTPKEGVLKKQLLDKRDAILKEAKEEISKYIKGETKQLVETALDDGDWSVIDLSEDINLLRLESHQQSLYKIDETLRKLREGSYGICEDCGEKISADRLRVMPFAIYCRDCQQKKEELEKAEREII